MLGLRDGLQAATAGMMVMSVRSLTVCGSRDRARRVRDSGEGQAEEGTGGWKREDPLSINAESIAAG